MLRLLRPLFLPSARFFYSRRDFLLENLALRQQPAIFKHKCVLPRFIATDKLFWIVLRRFWPDWKKALLIVNPETVVRWHHTRFKLHWNWISRRRELSLLRTD